MSKLVEISLFWLRTWVLLYMFAYKLVMKVTPVFTCVFLTRWAFWLNCFRLRQNSELFRWSLIARSKWQNFC